MKLATENLPLAPAEQQELAELAEVASSLIRPWGLSSDQLQHVLRILGGEVGR